MMRSPKSKHLGRYQWSEVQTFARELAERQSSLEAETEHLAQAEPFSSRIAREETLRNQRSLRETIRGQEAEKEQHLSKRVSTPQQKMNLDEFRAAWSRRRATMHASSHEAIEKERDAKGQNIQHHHHRDLESGALIIKEGHTDFTTMTFDERKEESSSQISTTNHEKGIASEEPSNPWEQLRDHFIGLRERRLQEAYTESSRREREEESPTGDHETYM